MIENLSGVFWADLLLDAGYFRNYKRANRRIRKLHRKRRITYLRKYKVYPNRRGIDVYCVRGHEPKDNLVASQEVPLSRLCVKFIPFSSEIRGPYGVNAATNPDREMVINGTLYNWELYAGGQTLFQLQQRMYAYEGTEDPILCVCPTEAYLSQVWAAAKPVKDIVYLALYHEVLKHPADAKIWRTYDAIEQERDERVGIALPGDED